MTDTGTFYTNYTFEYPNENVRIATSSFQDVPSNQNPLINLTMNGILRPSEKLHEIKMKFEGNVPTKNNLAQSYGTFVVCTSVYNARKVIKTVWDKQTKTLTVVVDLRKYNVRIKRPVQFSFSVQIDDRCLKVCQVLRQDFKSFSTKTIPSSVNPNIPTSFRKFKGIVTNYRQCPSSGCGETNFQKVTPKSFHCSGTCRYSCLKIGGICKLGGTSCCPNLNCNRTTALGGRRGQCGP